MAKVKIRVIDAYIYRKTKEGIKYLILKRAKNRGLSVNNYMQGNLLRQRVLPQDVAEAFFNQILLKKTTGNIITVDGGNIEASLR